MCHPWSVHANDTLRPDGSVTSVSAHSETASEFQYFPSVEKFQILPSGSVTVTEMIPG